MSNEAAMDRLPAHLAIDDQGWGVVRQSHWRNRRRRSKAEIPLFGSRSMPVDVKMLYGSEYCCVISAPLAA